MELIRGDGIAVSSRVDDIENRIARAEYAAAHIVNDASLWARYYEDRVEDNMLINDFKQLLWENKQLREKLNDAHYELESKS